MSQSVRRSNLFWEAGVNVQLQTFDFEMYLNIRPAVLALVEVVERQLGG